MQNPDGTIVKPDELENGMIDPPEDIDDEIFDGIHGSMIGMALGDALGAHVEFRPHQYMVENPVSNLESGGTWGLQKGQVNSKLHINIYLPVFILLFSLLTILLWLFALQIH